MPMKPWGWWRPIVVDEPEPRVPEPVPHHVCGVPGCEDGVVVHQDVRDTVVECETHNARTTHDTVKKDLGPQQVIRVQDTWRQHGTSGPPGR